MFDEPNFTESIIAIDYIGNHSYGIFLLSFEDFSEIMASCFLKNDQENWKEIMPKPIKIISSENFSKKTAEYEIDLIIRKNKLFQPVKCIISESVLLLNSRTNENV